MENFYAVDDISWGYLHSIVCVVSREAAGSFRCTYGADLCAEYTKFMSRFCEHTFATAAFLGEMTEHIDFISKDFPGTKFE